MEESAFRLQFEFLKSLGNTEEDCLRLIDGYLDASFGEGEEETKKNERAHLERYIAAMYR
jgi:hypothetical protein